MRTLNFSSRDMDKIFDAAMTYSVGFEDLFNRMHSSASIHTSYPPYNIVKETESEWRIEMALAGWSKDDIEISTETNVLTIKSKAEQESDGDFIHRGVAKRSFTKTFNIADDVEIGDITYENGLLNIKLTKIVPESQKRKVYDIK
ncbi:MAG: heat-shock protein IbpA [Libanvirus sp.]|jgi:molecular chaperone IbpA|nr:MAG: heat-shock protein IbpA [Libanvirus sp.]|tara:strand:+ start:1329 stop:1763 length:435 start_codon:yes stop_codon:yes gene_type:complete